MAQFEKTIPSFRLANTNYGDDLQGIAARELNDANRWPELVWLNQLTFPYLTSDENLVSSSVLLYGSLIKIPSPVGVHKDGALEERIYERDLMLVGGQLEFDDSGDFKIVTGTDNLKQQLKNRIDTPKGRLRRHPDYGCLIWRLVGTVNGPTASALGSSYVKTALLSDYRVSKVSNVKASINGDVVSVSAVATAIAGGKIDLI